MKDTALNGHVYDFSVDYDAIAVDDNLDIHKYLMKKHNMISKCLDLLKKRFSSINNFVRSKFVECSPTDYNSTKMYFNE